MVNFALMYPHSFELSRGSKDRPAVPIVHAGPGFDVLDLEARLGPEKFARLMAGIKRVFVCAHRAYPDDHALKGAEVHCVYVEDLEAFLDKEGD